MNRAMLLVPLALVTVFSLPRALAQPSDITPILEGVEPEPDGTLRAYWGYFSAEPGDSFVPVGVSNFFSPPPGFRGQPTILSSGRQYSVFSTVWDPNAAASLTWNLLGRQAVASASSPRPFGGILYQGRLVEGGLPVESPRDLRFTLYDAATTGAAVVGPYTASNVPISDGLFTVELPFSTEFNGQRMWLAVEVSLPGAGAFTALSPRQALTPTAYAHRARVADSAAAVPWANLTDVPSFVLNPPWSAVSGGINYAGGHVGIGTTTPNRPLTIVGTGASSEWIQFCAANGQSKWHINNQANGLNIAETDVGDARLLLAAGGNVGIGTSLPAQKLHVNGTIQASCGVLTCSDARFKDCVEPLVGALDTVSELRPVEFHWRQAEFPERNFADGPQIGFIAQDTQRILPQVVSTGGDGYLSVNYAGLTPVLTRAIQELRAEKDQQIARLQAENAELRARLDRLEQRLSPAGGGAPARR